MSPLAGKASTATPQSSRWRRQPPLSLKAARSVAWSQAYFERDRAGQRYDSGDPAHSANFRQSGDQIRGAVPSGLEAAAMTLLLHRHLRRQGPSRNSCPALLPQPPPRSREGRTRGLPVRLCRDGSKPERHHVRGGEWAGWGGRARGTAARAAGAGGVGISVILRIPSTLLSTTKPCPHPTDFRLCTRGFGLILDEHLR